MNRMYTPSSAARLTDEALVEALVNTAVRHCEADSTEDLSTLKFETIKRMKPKSLSSDYDD